MLRLFLIIMMMPLLCFANEGGLKEQAEEMGNALLKKDYPGFVHYSHPKIVKDLGGAEKMAASIEKQMKEMEEQGTQIISLSYGEPSAIVNQGREMQCTIAQTMIIQTPQGKIRAKSALIAISTDNGNRWCFVDMAGRDLESIRKSLPNISKSLVLPQQEPPQLLKD